MTKNDEYLRNSKNLSGLREETRGGLGKMRILARRLQHLTADNQGKLPRKLPNWKQEQYVYLKKKHLYVYFRNLNQGSDQ